MIQVLVVIVYSIIIASIQLHVTIADAFEAPDNMELSGIQEFVQTTKQELSHLRDRIDQLTAENQYLASSLNMIQSASKKALYEKWVELITLEEKYRNDDTFDLDEDPDMYLEMAANAGHDMAQLELGLLYAFGSSTVNQSYPMAAKYYALSARQGNAIAQCYLAISYHTGRGVDKNLHEAMRLYRLAAAQGHATAQNNLGWLLLTGGGDTWTPSTQNEKEAISWFYKAASKNDAFGKANLGLCYVLGVGGLEVNHEVALKLYKDIELDDVQRYAEVALDETPEWSRKMMKLFQIVADDGDRYAGAVLAMYKERRSNVDVADVFGDEEEEEGKGDKKGNGKLYARSAAI
jgi:TPR repeat protein/cell division protein FtsB